ncbi:hypothetical protein D1872_214120 [compost metagenome]
MDEEQELAGILDLSGGSGGSVGLFLLEQISPRTAEQRKLCAVLYVVLHARGCSGDLFRADQSLADNGMESGYLPAKNRNRPAMGQLADPVLCRCSAVLRVQNRSVRGGNDHV